MKETNVFQRLKMQWKKFLKKALHFLFTMCYIKNPRDKTYLNIFRNIFEKSG